MGDLLEIGRNGDDGIFIRLAAESQRVGATNGASDVAVDLRLQVSAEVSKEFDAVRHKEE
jgi:hypothetical protein